MVATTKVSEFTKETSFHGLQYIFDGSARKFRRAVWMICVTVAMILFVYQVADRTFVYFRYNTTVFVNIRYTKSVPFPAVTLRNINTFRISEAGKLGWYNCINDIFTAADWNANNSRSCPKSTEPVSEGDLRKSVTRMTHRLDDFIYLYLHGLTVDFAKAVEEYNEAYNRLSKHMLRYQDKWKEFSDDFYHENFLNLDVYYKYLTEEEIIQQPAFEFLSLLSEVGGFLGLLLGASVLTVCEILDFIVLAVATGWHTKNNKEKVTTNDNVSHTPVVPLVDDEKIKL